MRILHVDDEVGLVELAATFLEREDDRFVVETATGASEGLELLDDDVDCIVSDYDMPGTDGVAFLEAVREDYPELPFLLFTGKGSEEVASEAISAGVTDYLQKETGTSQYTVLANRIANSVEQYRSMRELESSRRRLDLLFEQSPLGVVEWNEAFEFERLNDAAEEILGYDESALLGESWTRIVPESQEREVSEVTEAVLRDEGGYHNVNENRRADGTVIVCEWHNRVITDEAGDVVTMVSLFQDVTERKEREWQLERHRENLEGLHEAANRLYVADSAEECYDVMIDAAVTILGFDWCTLAAPAEDDEEMFEIQAISDGAPLELGDRPFGVDEGVAGHVYQTKEASVVQNAQDSDQGEPTNDEIRAALTVPVADWGIFQAVATSRGAFDEQDRRHAELLVSSMLATIDRLEQQTELRERQRELERQNDRLDEFASVVSHDLRNPLSVADGRLELARDAIEAEQRTGDQRIGDDWAAVAEHLDAVERSHDRMQSLIDDLLALARHGETPTELSPVHLATLVDDCWAAVETADASLETDIDLRIRAEDTRLRQLFENCFRNAVEHAGPSVTVTVGELDDSDGFFIEDDGPGIRLEEREHLFDFGYSTSEEGTGFGLSIVAEIVEAHDWQIEVLDGSDGGARFEVSDVRVAE
ncbi:HTR-like protein [Salinarchaeum sp. Harcht-Bsk1]|nr:HTR-like protein [Salinarchaeum sp. Harcht-Bsk1]